MRTLLLFSTLFSAHLASIPAQSRFVAADYSNHYDWFHQHSHTEQLYEDHSTIFIFGLDAKLHRNPCLEAAVLKELKIGERVQNISYQNEQMPESEMNGYSDIWFHVKSGAQIGYIWGGNIAKAWKQTDLTGDQIPELILLGNASNSRTSPKDIKGELRIVQNHHLLYQKMVPGLCLFEDCATSALIRVLKDQPSKGATIIEASTMTMGCWASIEKTFFFWNGHRLSLIHHEELTTKKVFESHAFSYAHPSDNQTAQVCRFKGEDQNYLPIWDCKTIQISNKKASKKEIAYLGSD